MSSGTPSRGVRTPSTRRRPRRTGPTRSIRSPALAQTIAQMWLRKLEADFPGDQFRVYVTTKNDPIVRFHRVYDGEPVWGTNEEAAAQIASGEVSIYASQAGSRMAAV